MTEVFSVVGLGVWPFFTPPKSRKPHYFNQKNRSRRCPKGLKTRAGSLALLRQGHLGVLEDLVERRLRGARHQHAVTILPQPDFHLIALETDHQLHGLVPLGCLEAVSRIEARRHGAVVILDPLL